MTSYILNTYRLIKFLRHKLYFFAVQGSSLRRIQICITKKFSWEALVVGKHNFTQYTGCCRVEGSPAAPPAWCEAEGPAGCRACVVSPRSGTEAPLGRLFRIQTSRRTSTTSTTKQFSKYSDICIVKSFVQR